MARKTEVRVKRVDAWAWADKQGSAGQGSQIHLYTARIIKDLLPVTIIDRRDLAALEARLAAAEAECKEYQRQLKAAGVIIKTLRENHP